MSLDAWLYGQSSPPGYLHGRSKSKILQALITARALKKKATHTPICRCTHFLCEKTLVRPCPSQIVKWLRKKWISPQHILFSGTFSQRWGPSINPLQKEFLAEMILFIKLHILPFLQRCSQSGTDCSIKMQLSHRTAMSVPRQLCLMDEVQSYKSGVWASYRHAGTGFPRDLRRVKTHQDSVSMQWLQEKTTKN